MKEVHILGIEAFRFILEHPLRQIVQPRRRLHHTHRRGDLVNLVGFGEFADGESS